MRMIRCYSFFFLLALAGLVSFIILQIDFFKIHMEDVRLAFDFSIPRIMRREYEYVFILKLLPWIAPLSLIALALGSLKRISKGELEMSLGSLMAQIKNKHPEISKELEEKFKHRIHKEFEDK